jgi:hypothetical protein
MIHMSYPWVNGSEKLSVEDSSSFGTASPVVAAKIKELMPHEITDDQIERDKAGNRGLFMAEFRKILADCDQGDQDDPRWHELRLRTLDRMAKLTRVYEPDAPGLKQGPGDPRILAGQAAAFLSEMEASLAETRGPQTSVD